MIARPSPNFGDRKLPVSMAVVHYTGMRTADAALETLTSPASGVSSHYMIAEDGTVFVLVDEAQRAWHAGRGEWRGITDVNSASIGYELVNPGSEFGYTPFPRPQIAALIELLRAAFTRWPLMRPANVIGHSDLAPTRKDDPGELFPWPVLAEAGLAAPVPSGGPDPDWTDAGAAMALARYGYSIVDARAALVAFQRHFRPSRVDGVWDAQSRGVLLTLLRNEG
jgi:N-acetylmuramoyl-L-alanine amidase